MYRAIAFASVRKRLIFRNLFLCEARCPHRKAHPLRPQVNEANAAATKIKEERLLAERLEEQKILESATWPRSPLSGPLPGKRVESLVLELPSHSETRQKHSTL